VPTLDAAACAALMDELTKIAAQAAEKILDFANTATDVRTKADNSPVTAADEAAETVIRDGLARLAPQLPIISEEQAAREKPEAVGRGSYFLVDPLDGTREFIAGRGEYTVNIAIMSNGAPMLGIVCAPALGDFWRGIVGRGADRIAGAPPGRPTAIRTRARPKSEAVIMVSRSHLDARTRAYIENVPRAKIVQCGSAVKFARLAEGSADLYPRLAPTHDWDVAAGHAVVTAAGGRLAAPDGSPLVYGTADLLIPAFIAAGEPITA
jgi:3'(2'), 5'-bisphosphate nucleotidase